MTYAQGAVVVGQDPFGDGPRRPYLVVSNDSHPFRDEEYLAAVVTTTRRDAAVPLSADDYVEGRLPRQSYVSPWALLTLKRSHVLKRVAAVSRGVLAAVADAVLGYVEPPAGR